jgi:hypothetical protein
MILYWSQIDVNLWFRFIARGALGGQLSQQPQIEYGFRYDFDFCISFSIFSLAAKGFCITDYKFYVLISRLEPS